MLPQRTTLWRRRTGSRLFLSSIWWGTAGVWKHTCGSQTHQPRALTPPSGELTEVKTQQIPTITMCSIGLLVLVLIFCSCVIFRLVFLQHSKRWHIMCWCSQLPLLLTPSLWSFHARFVALLFCLWWSIPGVDMYRMRIKLNYLDGSKTSI